MDGMGPGEREPLRIAGYVLLGVAALAAIIGLIHMASGGPDGDAPSDTADQAAPASDTAAPSTAPLAPNAAPGTPNQLAAPAVPAPAAPVVPAPGVPPAPATPAPAAPVLPGAGLPSDSGSGSGSGSGSSARKGSGTYSSSTAKAPARVYNNSLIKGLAEQAAADMRDSGWTVTEVGNYSQGNIATSTVYYRPGTSEQAAAKHLASSLGMIAAPRFQGIANASPGLIVIVTKDYQRR
ncbi:MAG TPA: LytR C-terminal domain-containing protein [Pseudonocardia sp.]|nr:LytR C-terminal domain-containing protein [Pseudonocardia sp.]